MPGAAGISVAVFLGALGISTLVPHVYESAALVSVKSTGGTASLPADLTTSVIRLATTGTVLRSLARRIGEDGTSDAALAHARSLATVTELASGGFRVSFRAPTAEAAQLGAADMTSSIVAGVVSLGSAADKAREEEVARRTRDLALFVTAHPDIADTAAPAGSAKSPDAKSAAVGTDSTLMVLRDERRRLEAELGARAAAPSPSSVFGPNPYEDPAEAAETQKLQRRLGELKLAIAAHQKAIADRAAQSPSAAPVVRPANGAALEAEWRKLVQRVVEAQQPVPGASSASLAATVVEAPRLPDSPVSPSRWLVFLLSAAASLWGGLTFSLFRLRSTGRSSDRRRPGTSDRPPAGGSDRPPARAPNATVAVPPNAAVQVVDASGSGTRPAAAGLSPTLGAPDAAAPTTAVVVPVDRTVAADAPAQPAPPPATLGVPPLAGARPTSAFAATVAVQVDAPPPQKRSDPPETGRPASDPPRPRSDNPPPMGSNRRIETKIGFPPSDPPRAPMKSEPPRPRSDPPRAPMKSEPPRPRSDPPRAPMKSEPPRPRPRSDPPRADSSAAVTQVGPVPRETTVRPPARASMPPPPGPWPSREEVTRPSQPPGPRRTLSPPPDVAPASRAPDTRRMGSDPARAPATLPHGSQHPGAKHDTTYSIVDPARRSRRPEPPPDDRRLGNRGTRPLSTDAGVLRPGSDPPGPGNYEGRPPPPVRGVTRPGWAIPGPAPLPTTGEVVQRPSGTPPPGAEVVRPRSVPPSWRPPPPVEGPIAEVTELRDQLLSRMNGTCFVLGVVSGADAMHAKTALSVTLALMLAEAGARVLVLEANFDFPAVARALGVEMPKNSGFSQQLHARIRTGERTPWTVVRCTPNLHVIGEGFMRSPGVALSREFADALADLRGAYDFIIADGPIAGAGADSKPLNAYADGLIVAVLPGQSLPDAIERAAKWFSRKDLMAAVTFDER